MDANVSIRPAGEATLGTKTELKNMNSFRFLERGIEAEIERQERHPARRRRGRAGDAALRPARPARSPRCARRRRRTTTATSPSPTWCRSRRPSEMLERGPRRAAGAAGGARRAARARPRRCPRRRRGCWRSAPSSATSSRRRWPRRRRRSRRTLANWVDERAARRGIGDARPGRLEARARRARARWWRWWGRARCRSRPRRRCSTSWSTRAATRRAIVAARGLGRAGGGRARAIVERAMAEQPTRSRRSGRGNDKAIGAIVGAVMRETKGRADGGEVQRMIRERIGVCATGGVSSVTETAREETDGATDPDGRKRPLAPSPSGRRGRRRLRDRGATSSAASSSSGYIGTVPDGAGQGDPRARAPARGRARDHAAADRRRLAAAAARPLSRAGVGSLARAHRRALAAPLGADLAGLDGALHGAVRGRRAC